MFQIEKLSRDNIALVIDAVEFARKFYPDDTIKVYILGALNDSSVSGHPFLKNRQWSAFYVALDGDRVVGTVNLYMNKDRKDTLWSGWFLTEIEYLRKLCGVQMIHFINTTVLKMSRVNSTLAYLKWLSENPIREELITKLSDVFKFITTEQIDNAHRADHKISCVTLDLSELNEVSIESIREIGSYYAQFM